MDTIVVGVDGSETADAACREAATIALATGSRLHLVTAVDPRPPIETGIGGDTFTSSSVDDAEQVLQRTAQSLPKDLDVTIGAAAGKPAEILVEEAERLDASMIVVGNLHMQGMKRVLGSVANDVSHHARCSVYIAKTT